MSRVINIADGFTSATEPTISGGASSLLENYANDAAFVTANGTASPGDLYFNTGSNVVRYFNGSTWENIADNDSLTDHINDTSTHGITSTIVGISESQTLTNKTIVAANNTITTAAVGNLAATSLNAALSELQSDIDTRALGSDLSTHISDTTTHGTTGDIVGTSDSQVLTNKDIDGGTASNARRITLPKDTKSNLDLLTRKEGTIVYATDDDTIYIDDGASLIEVSGSGGSGSPDTIYYLQADDLTDVSGFATGDNATFFGGGSITGTFALETGSPFDGEQSLKYTQASGSANDYIATAVITIDPIFRGKTVGLNIPYKYDGATGDIGVVVYDVTNTSELLVASGNKLDAASTTKNFQNVFTIPSTCTQLRIGFHVLVEDIGSILEFDRIALSDRPFVYDGSVTLQAGFKAYRDSSSQVIATGAATIIQYNAEFYDTHSGFNTGTYTYTVPVAGKWNFGAYAAISSGTASGQVAMDIYKNGSVAARKYDQHVSTTSPVFDVTAILDCSVGDLIDIRISNTDTSYNVINSTTASYFSGFLINKTIDSVMTSETATLVYGARISNNGSSATIVSQGPEDFIATTTRNGTGRVDIVWTTDFFSTAPAISVTRERPTYSASSSSEPTVHAVTASGVTISIGDSTASAALDVNFMITVVRQGNDAKSASKALVARPVDRVVVLEDRKTAGTAGGTFTSGSFQTRTLNTPSGNDTSFMSLSSNQFTLQSGVYDISFSALAYQVGSHRAVIRNVTDSAYSLLGDSMFAGTTTGVSTTSCGRGIVEISSAKVFELQHRAEVTKTTSGFGTVADLGVEEVFARVVIKKIK